MSLSTNANCRNSVFHITGAKPRKCELCPETFYGIISLLRHRRKVHQGQIIRNSKKIVKVESPSACDFCGKMFTYKQYRDIHMSAACKKRDKTKDPEYPCEFCGKCFRFQASRYRHQKKVCGKNK